MTPEQTPENQRMPKWLIFSFVGFFGTMLIADAFLVYLSQTTWTGLSTTSAYEKGLAYNTALSQQKLQEASGWQHKTSLKAAGSKEAPQLAINFALADQNQKNIQRATVMATVVRPTHEGYDQEVKLPLGADGVYSQTVDLPLVGLWEVRIKAAHNGMLYQTNERVSLHTGS